MTGFIYAIGNADRVKIGYSQDPVSRAVKVRSDSSHNVRLIGAIAGTVSQERELHQLFSAYRVHGEWFERKGAVASFCLMLPPAAREAKAAARDHVFGLPLADIARALGVGRAAVCKWSKGRVPAERVLEVSRITGISRHDLRPDLYPREESAA